MINKKYKLIDIWLIDDDWPTNYLHQRIINKSGLAKSVVTLESAETALALLSEKQDAGSSYPDLILLDLNMPKVNGWEFLERFRQFNNKDTLIYMLSTTINPDDREKANGIKEIAGFKNKPLTKALLDEIRNTHFTKRA